MKKRLLILTQTIDKEDKELGFFHRWVNEFSHHTSLLNVICLKKGAFDFPKHVKILSLGKEQGQSRFQYIYRFYKYIWQERNNYDAIFVHMNEEYIIMGGLLWKMWGKRIGMWRNHPQGTSLTKYAVAMSDKVFCTSPKSFTAKFEKTKVMPAGIDVGQYESDSEYNKNSILFFGRLSPVKNVHVFIEALEALHSSGEDFRADIIGSPVNPEDWEYEQTLKKLGRRLIELGKLSFKPGLSHEDTAMLYKKYALYVNLTPDGSLDKTMLEAMASRTPSLLSNSAFRGHLPEMCQLMSNEAGSASEKMKTLLNLSEDEKLALGNKLRKYVEDTHGLSLLIKMLVKELS